MCKNKKTAIENGGILNKRGGNVMKKMKDKKRYNPYRSSNNNSTKRCRVVEKNK